MQHMFYYGLEDVEMSLNEFTIRGPGEIISPGRGKLFCPKGDDNRPLKPL